MSEYDPRRDGEASYTLALSVMRRAKEIWNEREKGFPPHCRMTWEQGTQAAREATIRRAMDEDRDNWRSIGDVAGKVAAGLNRGE